MSGYGSNAPGYVAPPPATGPATGGPPKLLIAGIVGSALAFIGSFLAWTSVDFDGQSETIRATEGDGIFTAVTSAAAIALFVVGLVRRNDKIAAISVLPTLITLVFGLLNLLDSERLARADIESDPEFEGISGDELDMLLKEFDFSPGVGLYVVLLGAVVAVVAGVMAGLKARQSQ
ncbi:hypothetical protein [Streptomyces sp. 6N223]|uniref:hypothetical protein n=1 Tax=Streptomyces sp. 6N223 TaxID=3457412 RepID=UPI003FCF95EC